MQVYVVSFRIAFSLAHYNDHAMEGPYFPYLLLVEGEQWV